jgi:hypothetical protein
MIGTLYFKVLSRVSLLLLPVALFAGDQPSAMLYTHGTALINGSAVERSSALFSGDLVETNASSAANITAAGSIVLISNDSLVQYQEHGVEVQHGGITVSTAKSLTTRAGGIVVAPAANVWTEFEVRDADGRVQIEARKGDVTISDDKGTTTLAQGQQTTREESTPQEDDKKKKKKKKAAAGAPPAGVGGVLNSPVAIGIGSAAIVGVAAWVFVQGDSPASPAKP